MNQYNFHPIIKRENTSSVKWGLTKEIFGADDVLPMWVADMDFQPPKEVMEALQKRLDHGIFGYTYLSTTTSNAIKQWLENKHNWTIEKDWILYDYGVVPSISTAIKAYTSPGDSILLQSPVYAPFFEMIEINDRKIVNSPLKLSHNRYEIDFEDFENHLKKGVKLFLLCNPHNPGGRVWNEEELRKIGDLCHQYNCLILSDEIHSDLIYKPNLHHPLVSLDEKYKDIVITCIAPTKTFNIAGLQASAVIIPNKKLRKAFQKIQRQQGFYSLSTFGIIGMEAAYEHGEAWLEELLVYLSENIRITKEFIQENVPNVSIIEPEGTYLIWIDCRELQLSDEEIKKALLEKGKLALEPGAKYGPGGEGFVRMNIACSRELLLDGLERFKKAFS